ncbi:hypothetical protein E4633_15120 [Geomonas terrae]|uniref:Uncharacterized protein n=1 Tax=Geomonas terrae TaxID=2562681 RepID=A0A4S1CF26_9BACT|nr:hypothetical protein [Geomonas terrae]TGU71636.1 hypothetical protein E4633_15120 [Geomonas terrae]
MNLPSEQFEVLANSLRIFPERILQLGYYVNEVRDPEEGIANIEAAFRDVLNQFYGMMGTLKDSGATQSLYEHTAITTLLCLRHSVQHHSGNVRNMFRDVILNRMDIKLVQIEYGASDKDRGRCPFPVSITWYEDSVMHSNYAKKWAEIARFLNLIELQRQARNQSIPWDNIYVDATSIITEAVATLCKLYSGHFSPSGYDSRVYYGHFINVEPLNMSDVTFI